ncbi:MAG: winged helix-turn-helix domain-containing protein [Desulfobacterium sp.]|nr:winged helix-turn-helix domain-containing protein [Desulfobacterium sp.]MDY0376508.1 winged helix-turn-helix domain-containing protein [Desulfobacterium sp.]
MIHMIIREFKITPEETKELIPSVRAKLIDNRVGWACTYLRKYALMSSPQCGQNQITDEGINILSLKPDRINNKFLKQLYQDEASDSFLDLKSRMNIDENDISNKTPEEIIGIQSEIINESLAKDLLNYISQIDLPPGKEVAKHHTHQRNTRLRWGTVIETIQQRCFHHHQQLSAFSS